MVLAALPTHIVSGHTISYHGFSIEIYYVPYLHTLCLTTLQAYQNVLSQLPIHIVSATPQAIMALVLKYIMSLTYAYCVWAGTLQAIGPEERIIL